MIERREPTFLMTPAQHRQWARILHSKGKPEKARLHEQLARAIELIARSNSSSRAAAAAQRR
jgi:hypothetical protein